MVRIAGRFLAIQRLIVRQKPMVQTVTVFSAVKVGSVILVTTLVVDGELPIDEKIVIRLNAVCMGFAVIPRVFVNPALVIVLFNTCVPSCK